MSILFLKYTTNLNKYLIKNIIKMSTTKNLEQVFQTFSKFGDKSSDGKAITLTNCDKWMKQAHVIDGQKITTTDTGICFSKLKSKTITYTDFVRYVDDLAAYKQVDPQEIKNKLMNCGAPGTSNTTQSVTIGGVDRLTDTTLYTGAHRERFDESGRGKGLAGREDVADNSGYVGGYKGADTYDKTHEKK